MSWQYSNGDLPNGASNARGVGTNRDSGRIAGLQLRDRHASVNSPNRTEFICTQW